MYQNKTITFEKTIKQEWNTPQILQLDLKDTRGGALNSTTEVPFMSNDSNLQS